MAAFVELSDQFSDADQPDAVSLDIKMGCRLIPSILKGGVASQIMK